MGGTLFNKVLLSHMNVFTQSINNCSINSSYFHQHYNTHKVLQSTRGDAVGLMAHIGGVAVGNAHTVGVTL